MLASPLYKQQLKAFVTILAEITGHKCKKVHKIFFVHFSINKMLCFFF